MEKRNNLILLFVFLLPQICVVLYWLNKPKESSTEILNAQKEILKIDTIIKRYDSVIYKTKIKTNEKIITIYILPDSVLVDSIRTRLQDFDSIGVPKNLSYNGAI